MTRYFIASIDGYKTVEVEEISKEVLDFIYFEWKSHKNQPNTEFVKIQELVDVEVMVSCAQSMLYQEITRLLESKIEFTIGVDLGGGRDE